MERDIETLIARLTAWQYLSRDEPLVKRALTDEAFYQELSRRLAACGLEFVDHPFADHVALRLRRDLEQSVFGDETTWLSNNLGLARDHVALLVVLWSLLILPKRSRQLTRQNDEQAVLQSEMSHHGPWRVSGPTYPSLFPLPQTLNASTVRALVVHPVMK